MKEEPQVFKGSWITTAQFSDLVVQNVFHRQLDRSSLPEIDPELQNRHILFRRKFTLDRIDSAEIRISADDYYKLYVNGAFVAQGPAAGYSFHYFYNRIDIARFLRPGENTIAVHTYYQGLINRVWVSGDRQHGLLLDLLVNGETVVARDGSRVGREFPLPGALRILRRGDGGISDAVHGAVRRRFPGGRLRAAGIRRFGMGVCEAAEAC